MFCATELGIYSLGPGMLLKDLKQRSGISQIFTLYRSPWLKCGRIQTEQEQRRIDSELL